MTGTLVILLVLLGVASALLMTRASRLARAFCPGPTVKGPGDVYVQAFQTLLCLAVLAAIVLLASIAAFTLSFRAGWSAGMWLSVLPVVCLGAVFARARLRRA
jgi:hypothetical protein